VDVIASILVSSLHTTESSHNHIFLALEIWRHGHAANDLRVTVVLRQSASNLVAITSRYTNNEDHGDIVTVHEIV
jgi:hypothetical protein